MLYCKPSPTRMDRRRKGFAFLAAVINLAAAARADYLVSRDKDLLSLATDHSLVAKQFRQRFPKIRIVTPVDFLEAVELSENA